MRVPVTAPHIDHSSPAREHDVRPTREIAAMKSKSKAGTVEDPAYQQFRPGMLTADPRHVPAAGFFRNPLRQRGA